MTYSMDLRQRVVAFVRDGGSKSEAARRFGVSRWCVYNWTNRKTLEPSKQGCPGPWKLSPEALKAHVEQYPDAYQHERAVALGVSRHVVLYGLKRLGIRRKKNATLPREERRLS
jgi:putative transposase